MIANAAPVKAQELLAKSTWMLIFLKGLILQGQLSEEILPLSSHLATDARHTTVQWEVEKNLLPQKEALTCMDVQQTLQRQPQLPDLTLSRLLLKQDSIELEFQQKEDSSMLTLIQTNLKECFSSIQTNTVGSTLKWESH